MAIIIDSIYMRELYNSSPSSPLLTNPHSRLQHAQPLLEVLRPDRQTTGLPRLGILGQHPNTSSLRRGTIVGLLQSNPGSRPPDQNHRHGHNGNKATSSTAAMVLAMVLIGFQTLITGGRFRQVIQNAVLSHIVVNNSSCQRRTTNSQWESNSRILACNVILTRNLRHPSLSVTRILDMLLLNNPRMPPPEKLHKEMRNTDLFCGV